MAGYSAGDFGANEAISIIQSYTKAMEHHLNYQEKLIQAIKASNMANNAALATRRNTNPTKYCSVYPGMKRPD